MKRHLFKIATVAILLCGYQMGFAQNNILRKTTNKYGNPNFIAFKSGIASKGFDTKAFLKSTLGLPDYAELKVQQKISSNDDSYVERYKMFVNNIEVENSTYILHYKNGMLTKMNGEAYRLPMSGLNKEARISVTQATEVAKKYIAAKKYISDIPGGGLKVFSPSLLYYPYSVEGEAPKLKLAYKIDVYAAVPLSRDYVYVDAVDGVILGKDPIIKHAASMGAYASNGVNAYASNTFGPAKKSSSPILIPTQVKTMYSGVKEIQTSELNGKYILLDATRGGGIRTYNNNKVDYPDFSQGVDFVDNDNNWTPQEYDNAKHDNAAFDVHWGVAKTYDYFKDYFNRNSYDDKGAIIKSYVHVGDGVDNAYWTGSEMAYGDGKNLLSPAVAFDITAHELGHAVCGSTAKLVYLGESGAINEALSDIWGAMVEKTYAPEKKRYLIGEDVTIVSPYYLRSLEDPKTGYTAQPDTYFGYSWFPSTYEEGCLFPPMQDNCGVHVNSGVINHWFYILSEGKTGTNDVPNSYSVTGIGMDKVAKMVYKAETEYITENTGFLEFKNLMIEVAKDLYGDGSNEVLQTQNAFYAVGIGLKPGQQPETNNPTPVTVTLDKVTKNSISIKWSESTDDTGVKGYNVYINDKLVAMTHGKNTAYNAISLIKNTKYKFQVSAIDVFDNASTLSNVVEVTTLDEFSYCPVMSFANSQKHNIKHFKVGDFDYVNTNTTDSYIDSSDKIIDLVPGNSYSLNLDITNKEIYSGFTADLTAVIYIDYNNDGVFDTDKEKVYSATDLKTDSPMLTGTINIPQDVNTLIGKAGVRIIVKPWYVSDPCDGGSSFGQAIDLSANFSKDLGTAEDVNNITVIYPNPVTDVISIRSKSLNNSQYEIYDVSGKIIKKGLLTDSKINVQNLPVGNYVLQLTDSKAQKVTERFIKK